MWFHGQALVIRLQLGRDKQRRASAPRQARVTPRRLCQVAPRANQRANQASQLETVHTYLQKALEEAESSSAGQSTRPVIRAHSALDNELAANGVVQCRPWKSCSMMYRSDRKKRSLDVRAYLRRNRRRSVKNQSEEKAGLKEKKNNCDVTKSRMSEFLRGRLKVRMNSLGTCTPVDYC